MYTDSPLKHILKLIYYTTIGGAFQYSIGSFFFPKAALQESVYNPNHLSFRRI